jgi:hypothetical protein
MSLRFTAVVLAGMILVNGYALSEYGKTIDELEENDRQRQIEHNNYYPKVIKCYYLLHDYGFFTTQELIANQSSQCEELTNE